MNSDQYNQSGFALLTTVVVVAVLLAIGLAILDVSIKSVSLSNNAVQSEVAFHAANAGMECVRYWRGDPTQRQNFINGNDAEMNCFGQVFDAEVSNVIANQGPGGDVYTHRFAVTHGSPNRCTQGTVVTLSSGDVGDEAAIDDSSATPFFPWNKGPFQCPAHGNCTIGFVRGYDTACVNVQTGTTFGEFTQREILLQF